MNELIQNGFNDSYASGWEAFAVGINHTHGEWPQFDDGWWAHYSEGA